MSDFVPNPSPQETGPTHDAVLVSRVRAGDEAAFEAMFRQYAGGLLDFAYGCTESKDDAEDVVQAVFVKLWLARERWAVRSSVAAYLALATRNEARDRAKHARVVERRRASVSLDAAHGGQLAAAGGDDEFEAAETAAAIRAALAALAPQRRAVCTLRWAHGLSYAEIAARLNLAPKTVERHLGLAYKELRQQIPHLPPLG